MLSGETAKGSYPIEAVTVMRKIAERTDPLVAFEIADDDSVSITEAMARGVVDVAETLDARLIIAATASGRSAISFKTIFSKEYVLAITNDEKAYNQMSLIRGVIPYLDGGTKTLDEFYCLAEKKAMELGLVKKGDIIVASCGEEVFKTGTSNSMKVIKVR